MQVHGGARPPEEEGVQRAQLRYRGQDQAAGALPQPAERLRLRDLLRGDTRRPHQVELKEGAKPRTCRKHWTLLFLNLPLVQEGQDDVQTEWDPAHARQEQDDQGKEQDDEGKEQDD